MSLHTTKGEVRSIVTSPLDEPREWLLTLTQKTTPPLHFLLKELNSNHCPDSSEENRAVVFSTSKDEMSVLRFWLWVGGSGEPKLYVLNNSWENTVRRIVQTFYGELV